MKPKSIKINAVLNVIKQCLSIFFPLITYPYVSRILGSGNLGKYSFSDSIIQILITISVIGIPTYAIREGARIRNNKNELISFCSEVYTINCISVIVAYLLLVLLVLFVPKIKTEALYISILSCNILSKCLGRDWLNTIYEDYLYISIRFIIVHIVALVAMFIFVKDREDCLIYVVIMALSQFFGNVLNIFYTRKRVPFKLVLSKDLSKHLHPILILFCSSIATTIYIRLDITILGFLKTDSDVGVYTMSSKIYSIVKGVLNAVIMVAIPRLSFYLGKKEESLKKYNDLLNNIIMALLLVLFPAVIGLFCLSDEVMLMLGGDEFLCGSGSLKILCFSLIFAVLGCFFAQGVLIVNRREKYFLIATIVSAVINTALNFIFIPLMGINGAAFTTLISEICVVILCRTYSKGIIIFDKKKIMKNAITAVTECALIVLISYVIKHFVDKVLIRSLLVIIFSLIVYLCILCITQNEIFLNTINNLKNRMKFLKKYTKE